MKILGRPYMLLSDSARTEFSQIEESEAQVAAHPYDAVIIGLAPKLFDYEHLNTAFRILKGEDRPKSSDSAPHAGSATSTSSLESAGKPVPLIATHKAKYVEKDDPPGLSLGPGPFVTALENATGAEAYVVGKPTKTFFELVINDFYSASELAPSQGEPDDAGEEEREGKIAVIGDDVEADLGEGAVELGLWRVLGERDLLRLSYLSCIKVLMMGYKPPSLSVRWFDS